MKGNKLNGILWVILAIFLTGFFINRMTEKRWDSFPLLSIHLGSKNNMDENLWNESIDKDDFKVFTFEADEISELNINLVNEDLQVISSDNANSIEVKIRNNVDIKKFFNVSKKRKTLNVERKKGTKINFPGIQKEAEVYISVPDQIFDYTQINNVSGKIFIKNLKSRKNEINNVSGRIEIYDSEGKMKINNVSGKILVELKELKNHFTATSVSEKIELSIPENSNFTADYETVSGSIKTDFTKTGKKSGTISNGSEDYDLQFETVSGSIEVNKL